MCFRVGWCTWYLNLWSYPLRNLAGIDDSPFSQHRVDYEVLKHALTIISPILELLNNGQSGRSHLSHLILVPQGLK